MDYRPFDVDPQLNFLRQTFSIRCLALFYNWHVVVPAVHFADVYLRWQRVRGFPHHIDASHFRKLPIKKLRAVKGAQGFACYEQK